MPYTGYSRFYINNNNTNIITNNNHTNNYTICDPTSVYEGIWVGINLNNNNSLSKMSTGSSCGSSSFYVGYC